MLIISRRDLYQLIWDHPLAEISAFYHVSKKLVAERCRRYHIPLPTDEYWWLMELGYEAKKTKLAENPIPTEVVLIIE